MEYRRISRQLGYRASHLWSGQRDASCGARFPQIYPSICLVWFRRSRFRDAASKEASIVDVDQADVNEVVIIFCWAASDWERSFAHPAVSSILTAELPSRGMTVPVTNQSVTGCRLICNNGSTPACCAAQRDGPLCPSRHQTACQRPAASAA
jgi:hypothetical protein